MFCQRSRSRVVASAFIILGAATQAHGQTGLGDDFARAVGKSVMACVRPSSVLSGCDIGSTKYSFPSMGRMNLSVTASWRGALTDNPYQAQFTLKFLSDGRGVEVLGIDYTDNCLVPAPDLRPLNALIRALNEKLASPSR